MARTILYLKEGIKSDYIIAGNFEEMVSPQGTVGYGTNTFAGYAFIPASNVLAGVTFIPDNINYQDIDTDCLVVS